MAGGLGRRFGPVEVFNCIYEVGSTVPDTICGVASVNLGNIALVVCVK
jgi:hypothetical protein